MALFVKTSWNEDIFNKLIHLATIEQVVNKIKGEDEIEVIIGEDKIYSLYKDFFGVKIEYGTVRITKINISMAIEMLSSFLEIKNIRDSSFTYSVKYNIPYLMEMASIYKLEKPKPQILKGYILNGELIQFKREAYDFLQIKYKDSPENIFYIYKFYFFKRNEELFMVIEKNIS